MTYIAEEDRLALRAERIRGWFEYLDELYDAVGLDTANLPTLPGFDNEPRMKPCEHRAEWMRGRLCLGCDNTGWRPLTRVERQEEQGIDPYAADLPKHRHVLVESDGAKRARESRLMDAVIAQLERNALIREGVAAQDTPEARRFRAVADKPYVLNKILAAVAYIREHKPDLYESLREERTLLILAAIIPGRIYPAPAL